ncbi:MAG: Asp-tRNA(Asn)/Glu-tRNA(Gln) amidotransferase subunit GatC [Rhodocyclaceae bacterium]
MPLSREQVSRIADLARIEISPAEVDTLQGELNRIFMLIERMRAVDAGAAAPMAHALDVSQPLREDVPAEGDRREEFLALAPEAEAGLYLVPKVIE